VCALDIDLERVVLSEFAAISDVIKIYVEIYLSEVIFTVFIGNNSYDDQIMDLLLSKELQVLARFPTVPISFHYLPFGSEFKTRYFVSGEGKLIFHA
jgi:hypothetical protein